jgi:hypothetical protein
MEIFLFQHVPHSITFLPRVKHYNTYHATVGLEMAMKVSALWEHFVAQVADESSIEMLLHVNLEVRRHSKPLVADRASVGLFSTMPHHVVPEYSK